MNYRGDSVEEDANLFCRNNPWQVGSVNALNCNVNAEAAGAAAGQGAIIFQGFQGRGYGGNIMQPTCTARWDLNPGNQLEENHTSANQRDDCHQGEQQAKWNVNPSSARLRDDDELLGFSVDQRSAQQTSAQKSITCTIIDRECQKNQALDTTTHSVDGCREFMRQGKEGQDAPQCMACGCHRSYHRSVRVGDDGKKMEDLHISLSRIGTVALNLMEATGRALPLLSARGGGDDLLAQKGLETVMKISIENLDHISKVTLSTVECIGILQQTAAGTTMANSSRFSSEVSTRKERVPGASSGKFVGVKAKRKRTQFTDEQRGKLQAYAEHAGWTIVGQRKENIATACKDIGVTPKTLKYWIHNAKQKLKRSNELLV